MRRRLSIVWAMLLLCGAGCVGPRLMEGPDGKKVPLLEANPLFIPLEHSGQAYDRVFDNTLTVLINNGFEILESNRYDGRIETVPRIAPGFGFRSIGKASPSHYERSLACLQTYRQRVSVMIQPADGDGYFIEVCIRKELEDLPRPLRATAGAAIFRTENNVERQFEVIDPTVMHSNWIYKGRDEAFEQRILCQLRKRM